MLLARWSDIFRVETWIVHFFVQNGHPLPPMLMLRGISFAVIFQLTSYRWFVGSGSGKGNFASGIPQWFESFPEKAGKGLCQKGEQSFSFNAQPCLMYTSPLFSVNISCRAPSYLQFEKINGSFKHMRMQMDFKEKCRCPFQAWTWGPATIFLWINKCWQVR